MCVCFVCLLGPLSLLCLVAGWGGDEGVVGEVLFLYIVSASCVGGSCGVTGSVGVSAQCVGRLVRVWSLFISGEGVLCAFLCVCPFAFV